MFKTNERTTKKQKVKRLLASAVYLRQEVTLKKSIIDELEEVENLACEIDSNESISLSQQLNELRNSLVKDVATLLTLQNKIKRAIAMLEDTRLRIIFEARYLNNRTWEEIAEMMYFSTIHIRRLANNGYTILSKSIFEDDCSYTCRGELHSPAISACN